MNEALSISTKLDMRPLMQRVGMLREQVESTPAEAHVYPAGLTAREVEVLLLMAQGKITREIAHELVISPRTVQRLTKNLYAKINVRNRATAFALNELRQGTLRIVLISLMAALVVNFAGGFHLLVVGLRRKGTLR